MCWLSTIMDASCAFSVLDLSLQEQRFPFLLVHTLFGDTNAMLL